jgi:hypothetical protein
LHLWRRVGYLGKPKGQGISSPDLERREEKRREEKRREEKRREEKRRD